MNRYHASRLFVHALAVLLLGAASAGVLAQPTVVRGRDFPVNGRTVQEIRMGNEPGSRTRVRIVVVTNGPTSGTTSLYTAVSDINDLARSEAPEPVFTSVIESGTVFSVGGGCQRGNQLDFPFINANRPRILRIVNGTPTVVTPGISGNEFFDSADCVVSGDGTRTFYIFTNRSLQRLWVFADAGGPTDLNNPLVSFAALTPFSGGLRPAISLVPGMGPSPGPGPARSAGSTGRTVALLYMLSNGQTRWLQYNLESFNVDFNCLVGTQTPPPTAFTIPRGAKVLDRRAISDLDGDGDFEVVRMTPGTAPNCTKTPIPTTVGPIAGVGYNWAEPLALRSHETNQDAFMAGFLVLFEGASSNPMLFPGPHAAAAGSFAACLANNTEVPNGMVSLSALEAGRLSAIHSKLGLPPPDPTAPYLFRSDFEDDDIFLRAFCLAFNQ